jgi:hypothetical protein
MIHSVFIFEGRTYDPANYGLFYDNSLSIHKTFSGAEKELESEKNALIEEGYILKSYNKVEINGEIKIECILEDDFLNDRILTANEWVIRE